MQTVELSNIDLAFSSAAVSAEAYCELEVLGQKFPSGRFCYKQRVRSCATNEELVLKEIDWNSSIRTSATAAATLDILQQSLREELQVLRDLAATGATPQPRASASYKGRGVLLLEHVEGTALSSPAFLERLEEQSGTERARTIAQLARALFELLSQVQATAPGFVHHNLSPSTVSVRTDISSLDEQFATGTFRLCLLDLEPNILFTHEAQVLGPKLNTPEEQALVHAAPEMLGGDSEMRAERRSSAALDVYAACSLMWELLCGKAPYNLEAKADFETPYNVKMRGEVVSSRLPKDSPGEVLVQILEQGLAVHPEERPSSEELAELLGYYLELFPHVESLAREEIQDPEPSVLQRLISIVLVLLIVFVSFFAWFVASRFQG